MSRKRIGFSSLLREACHMLTIFCHNDGRPFTQSAIEAALRHGSKRAGLRRIGSHVLRPVGSDERMAFGRT
jgi:hypothetical protein